MANIALIRWSGNEKTATFVEDVRTGVFVASVRADYADALVLLRQNGLRAMMLPEAVVKINESPKLKEQLKDKEFYLYGNGTSAFGYYTFNKNGEFTSGNGSIENTICIYEGRKPQILSVHADHDAMLNEGRYTLHAYFPSSKVVQVVVGIRDNSVFAGQMRR